MKIQCGLKTFKGKSISVNGTIYTVDDNLCIDTKNDEDAMRLLAGPNWSTNVLAHGRVIRKPKATKPAEAPVVDKEPPALPPADDDAEDLAETTEGPVDTNGNPVSEWPDPSVDMDPDYLRIIADAYGVTYKHNTGAKTLVKRINEAMFE